MKPYTGRKKLESDEERRHSRIARAAGWFVEKIMLTARGGFPDRFYATRHYKQRCKFCGRGRVVLMEWKREDGKPRDKQEKRIAELQAAGVEVYVVTSVMEANRILGSMRDEEET